MVDYVALEIKRYNRPSPPKAVLDIRWGWKPVGFWTRCLNWIKENYNGKEKNNI